MKPSPYHTTSGTSGSRPLARAGAAAVAQRNAVKALAALWPVANGLGRQPGHVYDAGA